MLPPLGMDRISVVISSRDRARELTRCLRSLASERSEIHEIIVADDGSVDDTAAVAAAAGCTVVRLAGRRGICAARNAGAARAAGEILVFIDDDTEAVPGWAAALRQAFGGGAALVGGGLRYPPPRSLAESYRGRYEQHDLHGRSGFLPFVCGANFAIRAEVFWRLGGFDEVLPSSEDLDLSFRVQLAGYSVQSAREATLIHWPRSSVASFLRQRAHHVRGDRVASLKYRAFPFQRTKLWRRSPLRVLLVQTSGQLMTGINGDLSRLTYPSLTAASVVAEWLGVLKADLELLTWRQPRPQRIRPLNERQRQTATALPDGPSALFLGDDRLVARLLRITFEASFDLSLAPCGLAGEALAHWDELAPPYSDLAREARRAGWLVPYSFLVHRLVRERPRTWGEAFSVLHAIQASLLRRPRFGILALGDASAPMARRFPELPVVAVGEHQVGGSRVIFQVTRGALLRDRIALMAELRRALRDQVPPSPAPAVPLVLPASPLPAFSTARSVPASPER